ncbi:MAG: hypothetical protein WCP01_02060 [Methylococcaceae bacterium]
MITSYYKNTPGEIRSLLIDTNRSGNNSAPVDMDEIMAILHTLESRALAFKKQGGDPWILRRVSERLEALSSQLVTR